MESFGLLSVSSNHPRESASSDASVEVASSVKVVEGDDNDGHDSVDISNVEDKSLFAKIVPLNLAAKKAFHELVTLQQQGRLCKSHDDNMKIKERKASVDKDDDDDDGDGTGDDDQDSDEETSDNPGSDAGTSNRAIKAPMSRGYFALSLKRPPHFAKGIGYRFGKGTEKGEYTDRGVDVLITPPGFSSKGVAAVHVLIQINPDSGVWMIGGGSSHASLRMDVCGVKLRFPEKLVLSRPESNFRIGDLEYSFEFTVPNENLDDYVGLRNDYLEDHFSVPPPHPKIWPFPRPPFGNKWYIDFHDKVGAGGFGMVSAGVDTGTGQPLAIKEIQIKDEQSRNQAISEINVARALSGLKGLISLQDTICEHGRKDPCGAIPENVFLIQPLARMDFETQDFLELEPKVKLKLFRDTLEGLESLHNAGYMHSDITTKNLMTLSLSPPQAAIIDFGAVTSQPLVFGPRTHPVTWPPEVTLRKFYNKSVDIFGLGLAWYRCLKIGSDPQYVHIDEGGCWGMISYLEFKANSSLEDAWFRNLCKLMIRMVQWNPTLRIDATSALNHPCWQPVREAYDDHPRPVDESDPGEDSSRKVARA